MAGSLSLLVLDRVSNIIRGDRLGSSLRENWQRFSNKLGGKWLFSRIIGFTVPYTGSIGA